MLPCVSNVLLKHSCVNTLVLFNEIEVSCVSCNLSSRKGGIALLIIRKNILL